MIGNYLNIAKKVRSECDGNALCGEQNADYVFGPEFLWGLGLIAILYCFDLYKEERKNYAESGAKNEPKKFIKKL